MFGEASPHEPRGSAAEAIAARLEARLSAEVGSLKSEMLSRVGQSMREMNEVIQARLNHIECRAGQDGMRIASVTRVQRLEPAVVQASEVDVDTPNLAWTRPPCKQILRVDMKACATVAAVEVANRDWLVESGLEEEE